MCDTVNKAERFFPVPNAAMARVEAEQRVEAGKGTTLCVFPHLLHARGHNSCNSLPFPTV